MSILLWICQGLLALLFVLAGIMKIALPIQKLSENMKWVLDFPPRAVRGIGALEIILGIAIVLPRFMGNVPISISVYAGYGIAAIMIGAIITHATRGEYPFIAMNVIVLAMALVVSVYIIK